MRYRRELTDRVEQLLSERRQKAQAELEQRLAWSYEKFPQLEQLERRQADCLVHLTSLTAKGAGREAIAATVREARELADRREALLRELGLPQGYLSLQPTCGKCNDSGFVRGLPCECYFTTLRRLAYEQSPMGSALRDMTFDNFSLDYYGQPGSQTRRMMEVNLRQARQFVEQFEQAPKSLLLMGGVGLGKTHLSSAIGGELAARGYHVIYESSSTLFAQLEAEKFGRPATQGLQDYLDCDLLIVDDLGSEFITSFVSTALFQILNGRLIRGRRTLLSTNFTLQELEEQYTQRVISRIQGEYLHLRFVGSDIREQQAKSGGGKL